MKEYIPDTSKWSRIRNRVDTYVAAVADYTGSSPEVNASADGHGYRIWNFDVNDYGVYTLFVSVITFDDHCFDEHNVPDDDETHYKYDLYYLYDNKGAEVLDMDGDTPHIVRYLKDTELADVFADATKLYRSQQWAK